MNVSDDRVTQSATTASPYVPISTYAAAIAGSMAVFIWSAWAQFVPNPDAALYLRAAELFVQRQWDAAVGLYGWPLYSLLIAGTMAITGFEALFAAQLINAGSTLIITLAFIGVVGQLTGDRLVVRCAAVVIVLQPLLTAFRSSIIRDNCYLAFFMLTLYLVARDSMSTRLWTKFAIAASVLAAGLIRIEGFYLGGLVMIYMVTRSQTQLRWHWIAIIVAFAGLLLPGGLLLWAPIRMGQWLSGDIDLAGQLDIVAKTAATVLPRLDKLKNDFLYPYGGGNAWGAYVGMTLGIAVVNIVRAITIPLAILTVFAFYPRQLMPRPVSYFVLWFAFGQIPLLLAYTFSALLLDKRHAAAIALVLSIPPAFILAESIRRWSIDRTARALLPVAAITLIVTWAFAIPRPSKLGYLRDAGLWIEREIPVSEKILTNDSRIAYYSRRPYGEAMRVLAASNPTDRQVEGYDVFVLRLDPRRGISPAIENITIKQAVRRFQGQDGASVIVLRRNRPNAAPSGNVSKDGTTAAEK